MTALSMSESWIHRDPVSQGDKTHGRELILVRVRFLRSRVASGIDFEEGEIACLTPQDVKVLLRLGAVEIIPEP